MLLLVARRSRPGTPGTGRKPEAPVRGSDRVADSPKPAPPCLWQSGGYGVAACRQTSRLAASGKALPCAPRPCGATSDGKAVGCGGSDEVELWVQKGQQLVDMASGRCAPRRPVWRARFDGPGQHGAPWPHTASLACRRPICPSRRRCPRPSRRWRTLMSRGANLSVRARPRRTPELDATGCLRGRRARRVRGRRLVGSAAGGRGGRAPGRIERARRSPWPMRGRSGLSHRRRFHNRQRQGRRLRGGGCLCVGRARENPIFHRYAFDCRRRRGGQDAYLISSRVSIAGTPARDGVVPAARCAASSRMGRHLVRLDAGDVADDLPHAVALRRGPRKPLLRR